MSLLWPRFLLSLGLIPLLIIAYIWILRRRRRFVVRYSSLSLVRDAQPQHARLRRHLPFALFLLALTSLIFALTRPVAIVTVPITQTTIILAIDASRSMCSTDILPNRMEAAKAAALAFIQGQKANTQIGIVVFSGFAAIIQSPTTDPELLIDSVNSIATARRTAIGSAILKAIDAIAEINKNVASSDNGAIAGPVATPLPKGAYVPAIIVLLTDGVSNVGPLPLDAAQQAADRGIRVYTIGFGTDANESIPNCGGGQFQRGDQFGGGGGGGQPFGGGGGFGGGFRRGLDEETLKQVAVFTDGKYYAAASADELQKVFRNLPTYLITQHETTEISVIFTAIGALLAALAILLSFAWHPLP